jgi:hypothetical protein
MNGTMADHAIRVRLENWARWANARSRRKNETMTGVICDNLRRAALGNVWAGGEARDPFDEGDAQLVEAAWRSLREPHKSMLWHCYIDNARPEVVCRKMRLPVRPLTVFASWLEKAVAEIERGLGV